MILQRGFCLSVLVFQEKLIESIKKIKHEIDECYEAEKDAFVEALEVEVCNTVMNINGDF